MAGRLVVGAQDVPDNAGEKGLAGEGGDDRRDDPADEHAGEGADPVRTALLADPSLCQLRS